LALSSYTPISGSAVGTDACSSDCCETTSCSNTGGCGSLPEEFGFFYGEGEGRGCNDYCASYNSTFGGTASGCSSGNGCYACEECISGQCKRYEDSCQCAGEAPDDCLECSSTGLWVPAANCVKDEGPGPTCVCIREDNYCSYTLTISRDCSTGAPNPDLNGSVYSPTGWVLVGVSSGGGVCHWDYCSNGSGALTDDCRDPSTAEKCCPNEEEECDCTHTNASEGTGETIYGPGRWCTPEVGGVPPPSNWEYHYTNDLGEKCYRETLGVDNGNPSSSECKNSCTGEPCECVSCHCHSDCPPGYECANGVCFNPTPPPA
jgi:hypothetical protein